MKMNFLIYFIVERLNVMVIAVRDKHYPIERVVRIGAQNVG